MAIIVVAVISIGVWAWFGAGTDLDLPPGQPALSSADISALSDETIINRVCVDITRRVYPRQADAAWLHAQPEAVGHVFVLSTALDTLGLMACARMLAIQEGVGGAITLETIGDAAHAVGAIDLASACRSGDPAQVDRLRATLGTVGRRLRAYIREHATDLAQP